MKLELWNRWKDDDRDDWSICFFEFGSSGEKYSRITFLTILNFTISIEYRFK